MWKTCDKDMHYMCVTCAHLITISNGQHFNNLFCVHFISLQDARVYKCQEGPKCCLFHIMNNYFTVGENCCFKVLPSSVK